MEEKMKILELVRDGKVTPEQGLELLDALEGAGSNRIVQEFVDLHSSTKPARNLKITTHSRKGNKMEFLIPLGVVRFAYNLFPNSTRITVNNKQLEVQDVMEKVYKGEKTVIHKDDSDNVVIELV
ncbi:MAG: SHOCT-like domain-containing protein [Bacillota bacterium]|jgi:hypothetical protein|nr:hypothetical protein [Bacillota bacterium]HOC06738.1 hypothetical protein [Bacillota bacterium]HPZ22419.1 hypothetical protein [Bacillota bacterium]HQD20291.1 hypothetical protein [Bacillota bacterium]